MNYIFIHGLGQNKSSWDKTISFMELKNDIVCPNLHSLLNNMDLTYKNMYSAFSNYCENISGTLNLCGLSLGGILALNYAIDNPAKVQSLVLIGIQYKMPKALLKMQNIIFRFIPQKSFKNIGFGKEDFIRLTNSMGNLDFTNQLDNIMCSTLVTCGNKDSVNKKSAEYLAKNIKNVKYKIIDNSGHVVNTDNPKELARELNDFYEGLKINNPAASHGVCCFF